MADNKKPTKKELKEFQELFQSLESDVGTSKISENVLEKLKKGQLSQAELDKLRTEVRSAVSPKVPPFPGAEALNRSEVKLPPNLRLKNETIDVPFTKVEGPSIPAGAAARTAQATETALVPVGERALQKIPGMTDVTANAVMRNPVLKKMILPFLLVGAGGTALYTNMDGNEQTKDSKVPEPPPSPTPTPTPTPPEVPSQPVTPTPAEPAVKKAPALNFDKYMQSMDQINKRYEQDRQISPELKAQFEQRQAGLEKALADARSIYEKSVSKAESDADRREAAIQWASIAESLGQSMVKYFAAREGARTGQLLGSKIQFAKYDWAKDLDRNLDRLTKQTNQAKTLLGIAREDVEAGMKTLGEERKTAMQEREAVAKQRAGLAEDVTKEQLRQEARSVSDYIEAQNRMALEGARETKAQAVTTQREKAAEAKAEAAKQKVLQDNFKKLQGGLRALAVKDSAAAQKAIGEAAEMLGIPVDEVDTIILKTTGKGITNFENIPEVRKIVEKYRPSQATPAPAPQSAGQPAAQADTVMVEDVTTGTRKPVPRNYLDTPAAKEALAKGELKIVGQ
jgi:hypothetical protein